MPRLLPDQSFYPSPSLAMEGRPEKLAYVALLNPPERPDAIGVVDVDPASPAMARWWARRHAFAGRRAAPLRLERVQLAPVPLRAQPHMERRYLVVPGISSSRISIFDTQPNPRQPELVKVIDGETIAAHRLHRAPHGALWPGWDLRERAG